MWGTWTCTCLRTRRNDIGQECGMRGQLERSDARDMVGATTRHVRGGDNAAVLRQSSGSKVKGEG